MNLLEEARQAAQQGDKVRARNLLRGILLQNRQVADAWMLYAQVAENQEQISYCLEQVLRLQPERQEAQAWLARLRAGDKSEKAQETPSAVAPQPLPSSSSQGADSRSWEQYCPFLGLEDDRQSLASFPSLLNLCYRNENDPRAVDTSHQSNFCLSWNHKRCPVFLARKEESKGEFLRRVPRLIGDSLAANLAKTRFWGLAFLLAFVLSQSCFQARFG